MRAPRWARCTRPRRRRSSQEIIEEAKDAGADVREFGELPGGELAGGNFLRPAIVVNPDPSLRVVTQEQFGPVIPVIGFDTEDEAVALANDTWGGLCGSVWTADPDAANRVGSQLVCGYVWVNDHGATRLDLRAPFGGMKQSGIGREQGIEGIRSFQDTRSIATHRRGGTRRAGALMARPWPTSSAFGEVPAAARSPPAPPVSNLSLDSPRRSPT